MNTKWILWFLEYLYELNPDAVMGWVRDLVEDEIMPDEPAFNWSDLD